MTTKALNDQSVLYTRFEDLDMGIRHWSMHRILRVTDRTVDVLCCPIGLEVNDRYGRAYTRLDRAKLEARGWAHSSRTGATYRLQPEDDLSTWIWTGRFWRRADEDVPQLRIPVAHLEDDGLPF